MHSERLSSASRAMVAGACLLALSASVHAQDTRRDLTVEIGDLAKEIAGQLGTDTKPSIASPLNRVRVLTIAGILVRVPRASLATVEDARLDEQLGADPDSNGTTSLVSRSGSPSAFAMGIETGGFSGPARTIVTARVTPLGVVGAIAGRRFGDTLPGGRAAWTRRVAFSVSFDTSGHGTIDPDVAFDHSGVSQWTVRAELFNRRDLAHPYLRWLWTTQRGLSADELAIENNRAWEAMTGDPAFVRWRIEVDDSIASARRDAADVEARLMAHFKQFPVEGADARPGERLGPASIRALRFASAASSTLVATPVSALSAGSIGSTLTMEYVNNRPVLTPAFSTIRLIFARGGNERTANAAVTVFDDPAAGGRRLRDIEFAGQIEALSASATPAPVTAAMAIRYQYFPDDPMFSPIGIDTSRAAIFRLQLLITARARPTGLRIPMSISFANRTEQIKERDTRFSIGLIWDFDAPFARLRP